MSNSKGEPELHDADSAVDTAQPRARAEHDEVLELLQKIKARQAEIDDVRKRCRQGTDGLKGELSKVKATSGKLSSSGALQQRPAKAQPAAAAP